jgi:hypothetical protein
VPSAAFSGHLAQLLADAVHLDDTRGQLQPGIPGRPARAAALNRAIVVMCVSAWESYVEELMRNALTSLRPGAPPLGVWSVHNASMQGQLGRFHTPNTENVRLLVSDVIGLADVDNSWAWQNCTSAQARQRLADALRLRHQIAHGVNPRPNVLTFYATQLPDFFLRLGRCTDNAVRNHLVNAHGIANPWPP